MQFDQLKRREFMTLLGGWTLAWPVVARAEQSAMPVIGILDFSSPTTSAPVIVAFHRGLAEFGFEDGRNVAIEYRWAAGQYDRLPALAAELVRLPVKVLVATGVTAALAAKATTTTVPIVFNTGGDPVKAGLVASLNRPDRNVTGVSNLGKVLLAKQCELLHELFPKADKIAFIVNPNNAVADAETADVQAAAGVLGQKLVVVKAGTEGEIDAAFETLVQEPVAALMVHLDPFFRSRRDQFVTLAARHAIPAIYALREYPTSGGLLSYGTSLGEAYRQMALYTGRLLKDAKPSDLPVVQAAKFELVINLKTARTLGVRLPDALLAVADEVIE